MEFALLLAAWVYVDRRRHAFTGPFEFDAFVFFAWPLAAPYYLYKISGAIGLVSGALLWLLAVLPDAVGSTAFQLTRLR